MSILKNAKFDIKRAQFDYFNEKIDDMAHEIFGLNDDDGRIVENRSK